MKYKAIIFDMDGTIADTEEIWKKANNLLIAKKAKVLDQKTQEELLLKLRGRCTSQSCEVIKNVLNLEDSIEELVVQKSTLAWQFYDENIKYIEGFKDFYNTVKKLNLASAIATNADDKSLHLTKTYLKLEDLFGPHIYNITHVDNKAKPLPDLYLFAAQKLNIDPRECIAIEDSGHGIEAAKKAGMFCIGINTSGKKDILKDADLVIDAYHEIDLHKLLLKSK